MRTLFARLRRLPASAHLAALLVLGAAVTLACGGYSETKFEGDFFDTFCDAVAECGTTTCEEMGTTEPGEGCGEGYEYDAKAAKDCINGLKNTTCDDYGYPVMPQACSEVCSYAE